ncbi:MAG: hypothetical protein IJD90_04250 [Clostridia bacterium]|nr:hypothetical protein [Clostridia bacterium]
MNKTNILSTILVIIFMISCFSFFNANATEEETLNNVDTPSISESEVVEPTTPEATIPEETTPVETESTTVAPTESTTFATVADPVYTQATSKTEKTTSTQGTSVSLTQYQDYYDSTKSTKEIKTTKPTEPTTPKKNITNYGSKFRPLKWISLILMVGSAAALVFVNVRYKKLYGKHTKKSKKLDSNARFTDKQSKFTYVEPADYIPKNLRKKHKLGEYAETPKATDDTIDLSSFSKDKKSDDDLYI